MIEDFVTLYLKSEPPSVDWVKAQSGVESCNITLDSKSLVNQYQIEFMGLSLIISIMPSEELPQHIAGFANYVMQLHKKNPCDYTVATLENIAKTKTALGCVIRPGLDEEGYLGGFLTNIAHEFQGLMFAQDSIFDSDGNVIMDAIDSEAR